MLAGLWVTTPELDADDAISRAVVQRHVAGLVSEPRNDIAKIRALLDAGACRVKDLHRLEITHHASCPMRNPRVLCCTCTGRFPVLRLRGDEPA